MAKRDVDQKVKKALGALVADKETAVRNLAETIDKIENADEQIANLIAARNALLAEAEQTFGAAKSAGWKLRELADAGLSLPKPIDAALTVSPALAASETPAVPDGNAGSQAGGTDAGDED